MGQDMVSVFLPPTPVPTAGFLIFVPREKIVVLDMSAEDGAKLLVSGGLVAPDYPAKPSKERDIPDKAEAVNPHEESGSPRHAGIDRAGCGSQHHVRLSGPGSRSIR